MEEMHYLIPGELKIIQDDDYFKFGTDSVLLANFTRVRSGDLIVDFGSGSGAIPLLLVHKQDPGRVIGVEIQPGMAELSRRNVELNNMGDRIEIKNADFKLISEHFKPESVDQVITNPPYMPITAGKITANKKKAIARHEIKANLEDVVREAAVILRYGGSLNIVHRSWRIPELFILLDRYNLIPKRLRMIQSRWNRPAERFLLQARKGAGEGLEVEPVLVVYEGNSDKYSKEVREMYGDDEYA